MVLGLLVGSGAGACLRMFQVDLGDMENEVRTAEESAKKALADSQRLADDLRRQQDAVASSEKQRRTVETQARHLNIAHQQRQ